MLNESLFRLIQRVFPEALVVNEGVAMECAYERNPFATRSEQFKKQLKKYHSGEEYKVNCPYCNDTRRRLYINHRWGVYDEETRTRNLWLAHCWNEECLSSYDRQKDLYWRIYENVLSGPRISRVTIGQTSNKPKRINSIIRLPGALWRIDDMKQRSPNHPAIEYLEDRLFDPVYLGRRYQVSFCPDSNQSFATNRIIAPIFMNGRLASWQARYLGTPPKDVPKWYTCPFSPRSRIFYNFDYAIKHHTKVIVEGPADVWGFGPQAMGLLGKSMTRDQQKLLAEHATDRSVYVILLDPEHDAAAKARGDKHHIEKLYESLMQDPHFGKRILKVYLPNGHDPAEMDREYMRDLIREEAAKCKLNVSFSPISTKQ